MGGCQETNGQSISKGKGKKKTFRGGRGGGKGVSNPGKINAGINEALRPVMVFFLR